MKDELPENLRDPLKVMERGRELMDRGKSKLAKAVEAARGGPAPTPKRLVNTGFNSTPPAPYAVRRYVQSHTGIHVENGAELVLASDYDSLARQVAGLRARVNDVERYYGESQMREIALKERVEALTTALSLARGLINRDGAAATFAIIERALEGEPK